MGVTAAQGWMAAAVSAGTKPSGELDLALVLSDRPATVAAAFTTNRSAGGHVHVCRDRTADGCARGVLVSAGISNSATGRPGIDDAYRMADLAADAAGIPPEEMLVCSTGTIGDRIPLDRIERAVTPLAAAISTDATAAMRAIMTTDTRPKTAVRTFEVDGRTVTVGGMCKGAGMIAPRMHVAHATMLAFITTDADASPSELRAALQAALPATFNSVTIDAARSTCDTVLLFANGASGVGCGADGAFGEAVRGVMSDLAHQIAADGEGATKVIRVRVTGAANDGEAHDGARAIADNILFRAAIWGDDPNWGRVAQSLGACDAIAFEPERLRVSICGIELCRDGLATGRKADAEPLLKADEVLVEAGLGAGAGCWEILTCDLTPEYVHCNADYVT